MKIPPLAPSREYKEVKAEIDARLAKIFESGHFVLGKEVKEFEEKFAKFCNVKYAACVSSGTAALFLSLKSLGLEKESH